MDPSSPNKPEVQDEPFIRDVSLALEFNLTDFETVAKVFEGELYYCERCGAGFAMWPPSLLAQHMLNQHSDNMTNQIIQANSVMLTIDGWTSAIATFIGIALTSRISLRRRARDLGIISAVRVPEPEPETKKPKSVITFPN